MTEVEMRFFPALTASFMIVFPSVSWGGETVFRTECKKTDDRGCTADGPVCYTAPHGKAINPGSLPAQGTVVNHWNKEPRCGKAVAGQLEYFQVPGAQSGVVAAYVTGFCANIHIESGSGFDNIGSNAFVNCRYGFSEFDIPK